MAGWVGWVRAAFVAVLGVYMAGVVVQATLAGVALFVPPTQDFDLHRSVGYLVHLVGIGAFILGLASRPGRPLVWWILTFGVVAFTQPLLPGLRVDSPYLAALHPVLAVLVFAIGVRILGGTADWLRALGRAA